MIARVFIGLVRVYQKSVRMCFPPACRFYPSCSQYAIDSVEKYGFFKGLYKSLIRILKCQPFSKGGYDPA